MNTPTSQIELYSIVNNVPVVPLFRVAVITLSLQNVRKTDLFLIRLIPYILHLLMIAHLRCFPSKSESMTNTHIYTPIRHQNDVPIPYNLSRVETLQNWRSSCEFYLLSLFVESTYSSMHKHLQIKGQRNSMKQTLKLMRVKRIAYVS